MTHNKQQAAGVLVGGPFPTLGDVNKTYVVRLTEPEINAIHAAHGFIKAAGVAPVLKRFAEHYGPTLEHLSKKLGVFDDGVED